MFAIASAVALAFVSSTLAQPGPLTPLAAEVGQPCVITWTPDATGTWKETNIQLMSGDNDNMVPVTTVTTVDTTSGAPATFTWTCPDVTLYAPVFFYQFSHAAEPNNLIWTTRWTIDSATGQSVAAPNAVEPDGSPVPWGVAQLKDLTQVKPAPSYIVGQSAAGANSTTSGTSMTVSASVTGSSAVSSSASASGSMVTVSKSASAPLSSTTDSSSNSTTASTGSSTSGASSTRSQVSAFAGVAGALFAAFVTFA